MGIIITAQRFTTRNEQATRANKQGTHFAHPLLVSNSVTYIPDPMSIDVINARRMRTTVTVVWFVCACVVYIKVAVAVFWEQSKHMGQMYASF